MLHRQDYKVLIKWLKPFYQRYKSTGNTNIDFLDMLSELFIELEKDNPSFKAHLFFNQLKKEGKQ